MRPVKLQADVGQILILGHTLRLGRNGYFTANFPTWVAKEPSGTTRTKNTPRYMGFHRINRPVC